MERDCVEELNGLRDEERYERMKDLEYELPKGSQPGYFDGYDLDKLLGGENPWPDDE